MVKCVISGGGDYTDSKKIDTIYKNMLSGKRIVYIPRAMHPEKYLSCHKWIQNVFPSNKGYTVHTLSEKEFIETKQEYLNMYDGIYLGGGNTYRLLKLIKETGFSKVITEFLNNNTPIYGGSAGAIIMGKEINTSNDMNAVKLSFKKTRGYNICNNHSIVCHFDSSPSNDSEIRDYVINYQIPVICLPEGVGIICNNNTYTIQGEKCAYIFNISGEKKKLAIGSKISL